ncbi:MAG: nuclease domain-containing protein [Ghiorsea sp.]
MSKVKSKKLRDSANGEVCTLRLIGICNYNEETTSLNHLPHWSNGMGTKPTDLSSCYGCSDCHAYIDGRLGKKRAEVEMELQEDMRRANIDTLTIFKEKGLLTIK